MAALQEELEGVKATTHRELSAQRAQLGEAENKLEKREEALRQALAAYEELKRQGMYVCIIGSIGLVWSMGGGLVVFLLY